METKVKERPIIFSGAMVRALLAGTKTQTRRIIKVQPDNEHYRISTLMSTTVDRRNEGRHFWGRYSAIGNSLLSRSEGYFPCPYGRPGDRLWVRETWAYEQFFGRTAKGGQVRAGMERKYKADGLYAANKWKPSIFMSRNMSRLLLEITAVRCERLQDISEADAKAEGCQIGIAPGVVRGTLPCVNCGRGQRDHSGVAFACNGTAGVFCPNTYKGGYAMLWDQINGPNSWGANPWVWVVEFKQVKA